MVPGRSGHPAGASHPSRPGPHSAAGVAAVGGLPWGTVSDEHPTDGRRPPPHGSREPRPDPIAAERASAPASGERGPGATAAKKVSAGAQAGFWPEEYTPTRADHVCLALIALSAVYGIVIMLARPTLLGYNPLVLAGLSGSRSALVTIGAQHAVGLTSMTVVVIAFVLSTVSAIKLDLLMWWAGSLWGDVFVTSMVGDSKRKARSAARAGEWARRYESLVIILMNVPVLPIPRGLIAAVLGVSGTRFRKLLAVDLTASAVVQAVWLYLGYRIGAPVVQVVEVIARYSLWLTVAIFVVIVIGAMRKAQREGARAADTADTVDTADTAETVDTADTADTGTPGVSGDRRPPEPGASTSA